ncbi:MAG: DMT family transporter [Lachnospiraceae bacterium]|nr:DMT family transporter [Lachnospiraceae bacterium]
MKKTALRSSFLLFLAAFIWGVAFVAQSVGMDYMGPFTFIGARFLMGSMVLLPLVVYRRKGKAVKQRTFGSRRDTLIGGVCCGLALCSAALLQQFGIVYTTVGKAGFITTLYIIIVPIMGIFLKRRVSGKVWIAALIAAAGMYLLCMSEGLRLSRGDTYVFICAILFSVHILVIDHFSDRADGVELSCLQFLTAGIIGSVLALIFEHPTLSNFAGGIIPLAYAGIMSSGVAYTLQVIGQKDLDPTVASLILSMESVVSMLAGWVILGQKLSHRELFGCVLVFAAVILAQLPEKENREAG